ncbi:hypothetical protein AB6A40_004765 [Gnathostoma spinigerum]|uniref:Uncharacterized protein n=1 Tax=Gnathostoma spinigerum TaxID=75299 RepID=A0ABD6EKW9_9BILA
MLWNIQRLCLKFMAQPSLMSRYKAVVFDLGGVIMTYKYMPYIERFFKLAMSPENAKVREQFIEMEKGNILFEDANKVFAPILEKDPQLKKQIEANMTSDNILSVFNNMKQDPDWMRVLFKLRENGIKTALLTNNVKKKGNITFTHMDYSIFDLVVMSAVEGIRKPDPEIFRRTAKRLDVRPEECVFVDDFEENCKGAKSIGMGAIWERNFDAISAIMELQSLLKIPLI